MGKRMHPSSVKFSRALAVGDNLSSRRIIDLGNHSVISLCDKMSCTLFPTLKKLLYSNGSY